MKNIKLIIFLLIGISLISFYNLYQDGMGKYTYHDKAITPLPMGFNTLFTGSGECEVCHGATGQGANPSALSDANGNDVSPVTDWRATMMANAAKDPLWRAKVSHEVLVNPAHKNELETTCTACHAPSGNKSALHDGALHYLISDLITDSIGLDGVNCTGCHSIAADGLGSVFSAQMTYDTTKNIYGQYTSPITGPMINNIGYTPVYATHISSSELCGSCHTLITNSVDTSGIPTGNTFVEQAIYHEWLNSDFNTDNNPQGQSCIDCHMKSLNDNVVIANSPPWLFARTPFSQHYFVGGNTFMLNILKNNNDSLNLSASQAQFDTVISRTLVQLQQQTVNLSLNEINRTNDTAYFSVYLENLAGHKFPGGYPSRRAYIEFLVTNSTNDTLFYSGRHDGQYRLLDESSTFEPHYNIIRSDTQVQIYEMVMGDIDSNVTTILERANYQLKDNRLTPKGFSTLHNAYDTVRIVGKALLDPNFNKINNIEGSGSDSIYYHIPLNGYAGQLNVVVKLRYQSVPPRYLDHMFTYSSQEIDLFKNLYQNANHVPVIVAVDSLFSFPVGNGYLPFPKHIEVYPTITNDFLQIKNTGNKSYDVEVYSNRGKLIKKIRITEHLQSIDVSSYSKGVYVIKIVNGEKSYIRKIVVM